MREGKVSVIIPVYNGSKFLDRSIGSVKAQTYTNWELVLVDDASTDDSPSVIESYKKELGDKVIAVRNPANSGISYSRNAGIKASDGAFIAILDQDDEWLPKKLEKQVQKFKENPSLGLVYCNNGSKRDGEWIYKKKQNLSPGSSRFDAQKKLFMGNFINSLTVLLSREAVEQAGLFDESITWGGDDYDLWFRIALEYDIDYVDEVLAIRHEHGTNYSADKEKMMQKTLELEQKFVSLCPELKQHIRERRSRIYYAFAAEQMQAGNKLAGIKALFKSLLWFPKISKKLVAKLIDSISKPA